MDVADALAIGARQRRRIGAAPARVAGVEQQPHRRPGVRHEGVDVALRLDDRAHVVMVAQRQASLGGALGEFAHPRAERSPFAAVQTWPLRQRRGPVALDVERICRCLDVVAKTSAPLTIGFNRRFDPNFAARRARIFAGAAAAATNFRISSSNATRSPIGSNSTPLSKRSRPAASHRRAARAGRRSGSGEAAPTQPPADCRPPPAVRCRLRRNDAVDPVADRSPRDCLVFQCVNVPVGPDGFANIEGARS